MSINGKAFIKQLSEKIKKYIEGPENETNYSVREYNIMASGITSEANELIGWYHRIRECDENGVPYCI